MFRTLCAHHQEAKTVIYASGIITLKQVSGLKLLKYNSTNMSTVVSNFRPLTCFSVMMPKAA